MVMWRKPFLLVVFVASAEASSASPRSHADPSGAFRQPGELGNLALQDLKLILLAAPAPRQSTRGLGNRRTQSSTARGSAASAGKKQFNEESENRDVIRYVRYIPELEMQKEVEACARENNMDPIEAQVLGVCARNIYALGCLYQLPKFQQLKNLAVGPAKEKKRWAMLLLAVMSNKIPRMRSKKAAAMQMARPQSKRMSASPSKSASRPSTPTRGGGITERQQARVGQPRRTQKTIPMDTTQRNNGENLGRASGSI